MKKLRNEKQERKNMSAYTKKNISEPSHPHHSELQSSFKLCDLVLQNRMSNTGGSTPSCNVVFSSGRGGGSSRRKKVSTRVERRPSLVQDEGQEEDGRWHTRGKKKPSVQIDQDFFRYTPHDEQHNIVFDTQKVHSHIHMNKVSIPYPIEKKWSIHN